jgi:hypothetical protein
MVITLRRNKRGQLKHRAYKRVKPLKAQYRSLKEYLYWLLIFGLILLLASRIVNASNGYTIEYRDVIQERIIWVEKAKTQDDIAQDLCRKYELDSDCFKILKAMRFKESTNGKYMTGDGGKSKGFYHIQTAMHGITEEVAMDFEKSTEWTIQNLIKNGYKTDKFTAIRKHNGSGSSAINYAKDVLKIIKYY